MELFNHHGHLTDETLRALSAGAEFSELDRLEIAEHLDFCDECLMRSVELFPEESLLIPQHSCRAALPAKIRQQMARIFANRYATAAAAIAIVITMWSCGLFGDIVHNSSHLTQRQGDFSQQLSELTISLNDRLQHLGTLFHYGTPPVPDPIIDPQGGTHS